MNMAISTTLTTIMQDFIR